MRELNQQEVEYIHGGHSHENDGMLTTAVKTVTMAGGGFLGGFVTQKYLERAKIDPKMAATFSVGVASTVSALVCLGIGMGKEYIYPAGNNKNQ